MEAVAATGLWLLLGENNYLKIQRMKIIKSWNQFKYILDNYTIISNALIKKAINDFRNKKVSKVESNLLIMVIFRILTSNNLYLTLGYLQNLNMDYKEYFIKYIKSIISLKTEGYKDVKIDSLIIEYGIREGKIIRSEIKPTSNFQKYKHFKLPITMNPLKYGYVIFESDGHYIVEINSGTIATIQTKEATDKSEKYNLISIHRNKNLLFTFKDIYIDNNSSFR